MLSFNGQCTVRSSHLALTYRCCAAAANTTLLKMTRPDKGLSLQCGSATQLHSTSQLPVPADWLHIHDSAEAPSVPPTCETFTLHVGSITGFSQHSMVIQGFRESTFSSIENIGSISFLRDLLKPSCCVRIVDFNPFFDNLHQDLLDSGGDLSRTTREELQGLLVLLLRVHGQRLLTFASLR